MKALFWKSTLERVFWFLAAATFPIVTGIVIWVTVPSGYHIRVLDYDYDPAHGTVTLTRNVMGSDRVVRSYISVTGADGQTCFDRDERMYSATDATGGPLTWDIIPVPNRLKPCLDKAPYTLVARFNTFFGPLPLKPTYYFEPPRG